MPRPALGALAAVLLLFLVAWPAEAGTSWANRPPVAQPMTSELHPPTTGYRVSAYDPEGSDLFYEWRISNDCGRWTPDLHRAEWYHGDDSDCHVRFGPGLHPATITVRILDNFAAATTCVYTGGSATGTSGECTSDSGPCGGDDLVFVEEFLGGYQFVSQNISDPAAHERHARAQSRVVLPDGTVVNSLRQCTTPFVPVKPEPRPATSSSGTAPSSTVQYVATWGLYLNTSRSWDVTITDWANTTLDPGALFSRGTWEPGQGNLTLQPMVAGGQGTGACQGDADVILRLMMDNLGGGGLDSANQSRAQGIPHVRAVAPPGVAGCPTGSVRLPARTGPANLSFDDLAEGTYRFEAWLDQDGDALPSEGEPSLRSSDLRLSGGAPTRSLELGSLSATSTPYRSSLASPPAAPPPAAPSPAPSSPPPPSPAPSPGSSATPGPDALAALALLVALALATRKRQR